MSRRAQEEADTYPRRYWDASTTWKNWNKLSSADIHHTLQTEAGFEGQNIYFYGNHPVQFVRVVGLLVDIEQRGRYTILTIDDSSGECINVRVRQRPIRHGDEAEYPSNTTVDNVDVKMELALPRLYLNSTLVDIGSVLEAKGTISVFRDARQIDLARLFRIKDTNAEAAAWAKTAQWKREVLSQPWVLGEEERRRVDERLREEERQERDRNRKRREWDAKRGEKRRVHDEKREEKRKRAEMKYNTGALAGSSVVPRPWE